MSEVNYTDFYRAYGAVVPIDLGPVNVAASVPITTSQGVLWSAPSTASIADIVFNITASGAVTGQEVDLYNAVTGGSSWLTGPVPIPSGVATSTRFSAAELGLLPTQYDKSLTDLDTFYNALVKGGAEFSLRALTPTGGSLTNLVVTVLLCPYAYQEP